MLIHWTSSSDIKLHQAIDYYLSVDYAALPPHIDRARVSTLKQYFLDWLEADWGLERIEGYRLKMECHYCQTMEDLDQLRNQLINLQIDPL